jgi:hypothetical protein
MRHHSLPQTSTPEQLAEWIQLNKVDTFNHEEKIQLTEEEIQNFEHQSALASRQIMKLTDVEKYFKELIKKGTPYSMEKEAHEPINVTIPPTKGKDALTANMEFANKQLELGYKLDITHLYLVPNPEESMMVMVDIEGVEWPGYSREMTKDEINQHKPLLRGSAAVKQTDAPLYMDEIGVIAHPKNKKERFTGDPDL